MEIEEWPMVHDDTEVHVIGFPDPFSNAMDFFDPCALKDSMAVMDKHLEGLDFEKEKIIYYQFSVLLMDEEKNHKLVYSYNGDKDIYISKGFEGVLVFDDGQTRLLPREEWLPYSSGRLVIRTIEEGELAHDCE